MFDTRAPLFPEVPDADAGTDPERLSDFARQLYCSHSWFEIARILNLSEHSIAKMLTTRHTRRDLTPRTATRSLSSFAASRWLALPDRLRGVHFVLPASEDGYLRAIEYMAAIRQFLIDGDPGHVQPFKGGWILVDRGHEEPERCSFLTRSAELRQWRAAILGTVEGDRAA